MTLFLKALKRKAEAIKKHFDLNKGYAIEKDGEYVYFPVKNKIKGYDYIEKPGKKLEQQPKSMKEALKKTFSDEEIKNIFTSFDTLGDIAVIEIPEGFEDREQKIGEAILEVHKNIRVVAKKVGRHHGTFRTQAVKVIAGENRLETQYKESGVTLNLRVGDAYFSPRLSTERERIRDLVQEGETIAGFFAGVGPFPLVIAKQKKCVIYAVELNPKAVELMNKNIQENKLEGKITPLLGDVREIAQTLPKCDRVLMPLPKGGEDFLEACMFVAKPGGVIHFYQFAPDENLYAEAEELIAKAAKKLGRDYEVINRKVIRAHAPRISQIVIDFKLNA